VSEANRERLEPEATGARRPREPLEPETVNIAALMGRHHSVGKLGSVCPSFGLVPHPGVVPPPHHSGVKLDHAISGS